MKVYGPLEQAGLEIVDSLPTDTFEGREVLLDDGNIYTFFEGEWKLTGSLTQAVKTVPSADPLDDAGDILGLDVDGQINSGFIRDTDKLPDQSGATAGQVLTTDGTDATWEDPTGTGGGLEVEYRDADFTAEFGKHYLVDTENNVVNVTLPSIAAVPVEEQGNAKIRFSDEGRSWHVNPMNLIPDPADKIYDADVGETYECNVMMTWIQIQRSADNIWNMDHVFQPIEQTGGEGGAAAGINYIIDGGDAEEGVLDVEVVGDGTIEGETVSPLIGESSYLARVNSSVTVQPKYRLAINEIDLAFLDATKLKGRGLFVTDSDGWKVRLIDASDDSIVTGTEVELPLGRTTISFGNVPETGKSYKYELYAETAPADATCTYDQLFYGFNETGAADLNGWKEYNENSPGIIIESRTAATPNDIKLKIVPYKDSINNTWRVVGNLNVSYNTGQTIPAIEILGLEIRPTGLVNGEYYGCAGYDASVNGSFAFVTTNDNASSNQFRGSNGGANPEWTWSFDIPLLSKPTWADYEPTGVALTNETLQTNARTSYYMSASQTISVGGTAILFDSLWTTPDYFNVTNGRFTIPVNGDYRITANLQYSNFTVGSAAIRLYKNDAILSRLANLLYTDNQIHMCASEIHTFNAGDEVYIGVGIGGGADITINGGMAESSAIVEKISNFTSETTVVADLATKDTAGFVKSFEGDQVLASGLYTPTITQSSNVDGGATTYESVWSRVGDIVTVAGRIDIDATVAGIWTARITLPIDPDENFSGNKAFGSGNASRNNVFGVRILSVSGEKTVEFACYAGDAGIGLAYSYTFMYRLR